MVIGDLLSKNLFAALTVGLRHYVLVHCKADPDQDAPEHPGMKPRRPSGIINAETAAQLGMMITPAQGRVSVSPIRPRHLSHLGTTVRTTLYGILSHPKQLPRKPHTDALPTAKPATCST